MTISHMHSPHIYKYTHRHTKTICKQHMVHLMNSSDEVTIRKRASVMTWPVNPAAVTRHTAIGF